jgi:hypothetical protein
MRIKKRLDQKVTLIPGGLFVRSSLSKLHEGEITQSKKEVD